MRRAFTVIELIVVVLMFATLVAVFGPQLTRNRGFEMRMQSQAKLQVIGLAAGQYQRANRNYLPLFTIGQRGIGPGPQGQNASGICTWSYGGKNNNAFWYASSGGIFDVEAADRPLNAYVYPGFTFTAPPAPARLPANDPARTKQQADAYRDPSDIVTHQRNWPLPTPGISTYDDVGSSYEANYVWWNYVQGTFAGRVITGTARIANNQGATPSRFVWLTDSYASFVQNNSDSNYKFKNPYGDENCSVMLFEDGHVGYHKLAPGTSNTRFNTSYYQFTIE
jgi:type II secretory pathway pseudopilin PulG